MNKQLTLFKDSFKLDITFIKVIIFDLLFYVILIPSFFVVGILLNKWAQKMDLDMLNQQILTKSAEEIQALTSQVQSFIAILIITVVILVLIILAAWSLSRGLIYTTLLKKKLTKGYFLKFMLLNLIIGIVALILLIFFSVIVNAIPPAIYLFYAVVLIAGYLSVLMCVLFTKKNKIFNSIVKGFSEGAIKLKKLIIPCVLILVVFIILSLISFLLGRAQLTITPYISLLIFVIFMAWARIYFVRQAEKVIS